MNFFEERRLKKEQKRIEQRKKDIKFLRNGAAALICMIGFVLILAGDYPMAIFLVLFGLSITTYFDLFIKQIGVNIKKPLRIMISVFLFIMIGVAAPSESPEESTDSKPQITETLKYIEEKDSTEIVSDDKEEIETPIKEKEQSVTKITMNEDNYFYETEDWTLETLVAEFENMGFTNIKTVALAEGSDYVYGPISTVRINGKRTGWDVGDEYYSNDEVEIGYQKPTPTLTKENCPDLAAILNGDVEYWGRFAEKYDGQFIEFDGFVQERIESVVLGDPIINVSGGDYSEDNLSNQQIRLKFISLDSDIDAHVIYGSVGDNMKIIGKIDSKWSEYNKLLTINVYLAEER